MGGGVLSLLLTGYAVIIEVGTSDSIQMHWGFFSASRIKPSQDH